PSAPWLSPPPDPLAPSSGWPDPQLFAFHLKISSNAFPIRERPGRSPQGVSVPTHCPPPPVSAIPSWKGQRDPPPVPDVSRSAGSKPPVFSGHHPRPFPPTAVPPEKGSGCPAESQAGEAWRSVESRRSPDE